MSPCPSSGSHAHQDGRLVADRQPLACTQRNPRRDLLDDQRTIQFVALAQVLAAVARHLDPAAMVVDAGATDRFESLAVARPGLTNREIADLADDTQSQIDDSHRAVGNVEIPAAAMFGDD